MCAVRGSHFWQFGSIASLATEITDMEILVAFLAQTWPQKELGQHGTPSIISPTMCHYRAGASYFRLVQPLRAHISVNKAGGSRGDAPSVGTLTLLFYTSVA